jgi:hypothetical protein
MFGEAPEHGAQNTHGHKNRGTSQVWRALG